jgi:hypothetical protein
MPTIDPVAAAVDAIVASLLASLGPSGDNVVSTVLRGWPEDATALDLSGKPVISVTPGNEEREDVSPRSLGSVTSGGVTTHTYRVGYLRFTAQIDLWAAHRVQMDDVAPYVESACGEDPPRPAILRLTSTGYHSRPLVCHLGAGVADLDGDSAVKGEWRMSWDLRVETDIVRTTTHVPQSRVDFEVTVDDGDAETINAFGA